MGITQSCCSIIRLENAPPVFWRRESAAEMSRNPQQKIIVNINAIVPPRRLYNADKIPVELRWRNVNDDSNPRRDTPAFRRIVFRIRRMTRDPNRKRRRSAETCWLPGSRDSYV
jgi:hypothetical protein